MSTYAVTWRDRGGPIYAGKLELVRDGIRLEGGSRSGKQISVVKLRHEDLIEATMAPFRERVGNQPTVSVSNPRGLLHIAPVGAGVAREILELVQRAGTEGNGRDR
jgi:hypothetical protein